MNNSKKCKVVRLATTDKVNGIFVNTPGCIYGNYRYHLYVLAPKEDEIKDTDFTFDSEMGTIIKACDDICTLNVLNSMDNIHRVIASTNDRLNLHTIKPEDIRQYCAEGGIDEVMVEYEQYIFYTEDGTEIPKYIPKVNPDNTINIHRVKDTWTRDEVIEQMNKVRQYCKIYYKNDSLHQVYYNWEDWIEKNV